MIKVAIIGAGGAGLCATRHLLQSSDINAVVYEERDCVGGQWVYEENVKNPFSSVYKNLRTNLPKQVMGFLEFPFPEDLPSFVHHTDVRNYLDNYTKHFQLYKYIKFQTKVVEISPVLNPDNDEENSENHFVRWKVKTESTSTGNVDCDLYDAVIVCNGHFSVPVYPSITGFGYYQGEFLHSHYYRHPNEYKDKSVLILGGGNSAIDIMLDISQVSKFVYWSHHGTRCSSKLPINVKEFEDISFVNTNGEFIFEKCDALVRIDCLITCSGYHYSYPFLSDQCGIEVENRTVKTLYRHIFNIKYPSMAFVGIPWATIPFPLINQQCAYIRSILTGDKELPNKREMLRDVQMDQRDRLASGEPTKFFHRLRTRQFQYCDDLAEKSGYEKYSKCFERLYCFNIEQRENNLQNYKQLNYKILNDEQFEVL